MKKYYRAIFLSDLHLGIQESKVQLLEKFLKKSRTDYIYIVGDFFDCWHTRVNKGWSQECNVFIKRIFKMIKKGTKIVILPGNHDVLLYLIEGFKFGNIEICEETIHITKKQKRIIVLHGDSFDMFVSKSHSISLFINMIYELLMGFKWIKPIISRLKNRVDLVVKKLTKFEQNAIQYVNKKNCDGVICGHSHVPALKNIKNKIYANCGDLVHNATILVERKNGTLKLLDLNKYF